MMRRRHCCHVMRVLVPLLVMGNASAAAINTTDVTWYVVWVGGQSNSRGTNSQALEIPRQALW